MGWLRMMFGTPKPVERLTKKYVKPVGDILEVKNNILDSVENVLDTVSVDKRIYHTITDDTVNDAKQKYHKGDHIATIRSLYSHHGIYDGDGWVYEYQEGKIMFRSLEDFADNDDLYVVSESSRRCKSFQHPLQHNIFHHEACNSNNASSCCKLRPAVQQLHLYSDRCE